MVTHTDNRKYMVNAISVLTADLAIKIIVIQWLVRSEFQSFPLILIAQRNSQGSYSDFL